MNDPFVIRMNQSIDEIWPGISRSLSEISSVTPEAARSILCILLEYSCQATHHGAISAGRNAISQMPPAWLENNLAGCVDQSLDLKDGWDYLRLLELLNITRSSLLPDYIKLGLDSENEEVKEYALMFNK